MLHVFIYIYIYTWYIYIYIYTIFSVCHMVSVGSHCASTWFVHSSYLVIHPPFVSVNYLHPIAAEVLIVPLRTVNLHCKNYISVNSLTFVFII